MWAQMVRTKLKPGREAEVEDLGRQLEDRNNPAWVRSTIFSNQDNPREHYVVVLFESEEAARQHEQHPEQHELVTRLLDCYEEPPEFIDLELIKRAVASPRDEGGGASGGGPRLSDVRPPLRSTFRSATRICDSTCRATRERHQCAPGRGRSRAGR